MNPGLLDQLVEIGAIQFGQFETTPGVFAPLSLALHFVPSYPALLQQLSEALCPLAKIEGITRLLPMPGCVPLGTALSLVSGLPLVYPSGENPHQVEGAYDYNVRTVLLTHVLAEGIPESEQIRRVRRDGLDVEAVIAVFDVGRCSKLSTPWGEISPTVLFSPTDLLKTAPTPSMREAAARWMAG